MRHDELPRNPRQLTPIDVLIFLGAVTLAVLFLAVWFDFDPWVVYSLSQFTMAMGAAMVGYCGMLLWERRR